MEFGASKPSKILLDKLGFPCILCFNDFNDGDGGSPFANSVMAADVGSVKGEGIESDSLLGLSWISSRMTVDVYHWM